MNIAPRASVPTIRDMRHTDLASVLGIEQEAYEFPWSIGIFRDCLLARYTSIVLEQDRELLGYAIMSVAADEAHLLNIALARSARGCGFGRMLMDHLMQAAHRARATTMYLEVRPSNAPALRLYQQCGFEVSGRRRRYYRARGGSEDAIVLLREL